MNLIALCGNPKSGKTTLAQTMASEYGYREIDDGLVLRNAVPVLFGTDPSLCFTQEGKATLVDTPKGLRTVRDLLGSLGNVLEQEFGEFFMPYYAMQQVKELQDSASYSGYVFPSVRKTQPQYYAAQGALVIEVHRDNCPPTGHDFDTWDKESVHVRLLNNGTPKNLADAALGALASFKLGRLKPDTVISAMDYWQGGQDV